VNTQHAGYQPNEQLHSGNKSAQSSPQKPQKMQQQADLTSTSQVGSSLQQQQMYKQFLEGIKITDNTMANPGNQNNMYSKQGKQFNTISASQTNQHGLTPSPMLHHGH